VHLTSAQLAMLWAPLARASMRCRAARHRLAASMLDLGIAQNVKKTTCFPLLTLIFVQLFGRKIHASRRRDPARRSRCTEDFGPVVARGFACP
jgi:hypothetical protein